MSCVMRKPAFCSVKTKVQISSMVGGHYANMSVQYAAIFHDYKNDYFKMKFLNIFLIFAQNIDCGYTLEPPQ